MIKKLILTCLALAGLITGCQKAGVPDTNTTTAAAEPLMKGEPVVVAYYFHRTVRCPTCLAIEATAARVVNEDFSQQVAEGRLMWVPCNLDDPDAKDFQKQFDVSGSTLVLSKLDGRNDPKYKKLENVWELVGDSAKFDDYVRAEVHQFLNE
jgi:hypothetical protein